MPKDLWCTKEMTDNSNKPKILSGHQPTYLPWLGLFHKASVADIWVFEDFAQYQVKDWYNRNYIKAPTGKIFLTVPVDLREGSLTPIKEVKIDTTQKWQREHWMRIRYNYSKTKYFRVFSHFFEELYLKKKWRYLSDLNWYILDWFFKLLEIQVDFIVGSEQNYKFRKSNLNLEMCQRHGAEICVFGANGRDYVVEEDFRKANVKIYFQEYRYPVYRQRFGEFISHLSIIDILFNCGPETKKFIQKHNVTKDDIYSLAI